MKRNIWADIITYFFILLFTYTAAAKFMDLRASKDQLNYSPLLGSMTGIVAWIMPIGEILLVVALIVPKWRLKALYATFVLMILFTGYVIILLSIDAHLSCSCGGIIEELTPRQHIFFNSACVILSGLAIGMSRKDQLSRRMKWGLRSSIIGLFLAIGWCLFTAFTAPVVIRTGLEGSPLPSFHLLLVDSLTHVNTRDIPTGQPVIMIGFSPWCKHCQDETRDILQHMNQLKNVRIYYITDYPFDQMKTFYAYFKLAQYPNIIMGTDLDKYFLPHYKASGIPYTVIFDAKLRLQKVLQGQTGAAKLIETLYR